MMSRSIQNITRILFIVICFTTGCSTANNGSQEKIFSNQEGVLRWAGSPVVDGAGMLFIVGGVEYGAPGSPEDYPEFFTDDIHEVNIRADFKLTGEETVRGWGAAFPAIEFIEIEKI